MDNPNGEDNNGSNDSDPSLDNTIAKQKDRRRNASTSGPAVEEDNENNENDGIAQNTTRDCDLTYETLEEEDSQTTAWQRSFENLWDKARKISNLAERHRAFKKLLDKYIDNIQINNRRDTCKATSPEGYKIQAVCQKCRRFGTHFVECVSKINPNTKKNIHRYCIDCLLKHAMANNGEPLRCAGRFPEETHYCGLFEGEYQRLKHSQYSLLAKGAVWCEKCGAYFKIEEWDVHQCWPQIKGDDIDQTNAEDEAEDNIPLTAERHRFVRQLLAASQRENRQLKRQMQAMITTPVVSNTVADMAENPEVVKLRRDNANLNKDLQSKRLEIENLKNMHMATTSSDSRSLAKQVIHFKNDNSKKSKLIKDMYGVSGETVPELKQEIIRLKGLLTNNVKKTNDFIANANVTMEQLKKRLEEMDEMVKIRTESAELVIWSSELRRKTEVIQTIQLERLIQNKRHDLAKRLVANTIVLPTSKTIIPTKYTRVALMDEEIPTGVTDVGAYDGNTPLTQIIEDSYNKLNRNGRENAVMLVLTTTAVSFQESQDKDLLLRDLPIDLSQRVTISVIEGNKFQELKRQFDTNEYNSLIVKVEGLLENAMNEGQEVPVPSEDQLDQLAKTNWALKLAQFQEKEQHLKQFEEPFKERYEALSEEANRLAIPFKRVSEFGSAPENLWNPHSNMVIWPQTPAPIHFIKNSKLRSLTSTVSVNPNKGQSTAERSNRKRVMTTEITTGEPYITPPAIEPMEVEQRENVVDGDVEWLAPNFEAHKPWFIIPPPQRREGQLKIEEPSQSEHFKKVVTREELATLTEEELAKLGVGIVKTEPQDPTEEQ